MYVHKIHFKSMWNYTGGNKTFNLNFITVDLSDKRQERHPSFYHSAGLHSYIFVQNVYRGKKIQDSYISFMSLTPIHDSHTLNTKRLQPLVWGPSRYESNSRLLFLSHHLYVHEYKLSARIPSSLVRSTIQEVSSDVIETPSISYIFARSYASRHRLHL